MMRPILIAFLSFLSISVHADDASLAAGNEAYKNGNFTEAIEAYEDALADVPDAAVYYNLGNAYYKTGRYARSILQYERALKLAPNDADIQHNLALANLRIIDKIEPSAEFFLITWWKQLAARAHANAWTIAFLALLWVGILGLLAFVLTRGLLRKLLFFSGLGSLAIGVIVLFLAITQYQFETNDDTAIIMAPSVSVKSEPVNSGTDLFIIHEGLKVSVIGQESDWLRICLADGKEGWVNTSALEVI